MASFDFLLMQLTQNIKQPKKPKNVKSSGTYGGGSSSSSKKSSSSSSRSRSSSERTESVYRPGDEKKSYLGDVKKQQITKKTSKPKKDEEHKELNVVFIDGTGFYSL